MYLVWQKKRTLSWCLSVNFGQIWWKWGIFSDKLNSNQLDTRPLLVSMGKSRLEFVLPRIWQRDEMNLSALLKSQARASSRSRAMLPPSKNIRSFYSSSLRQSSVLFSRHGNRQRYQPTSTSLTTKQLAIRPGHDYKIPFRSFDPSHVSFRLAALATGSHRAARKLITKEP